MDITLPVPPRGAPGLTAGTWNPGEARARLAWSSADNGASTAAPQQHGSRSHHGIQGPMAQRHPQALRRSGGILYIRCGMATQGC